MRKGRKISVANDNTPFPDGSTVSVSSSRPFDSKYFQGELINEDVSSLLPGQMIWQPGRTRYEINDPRKNNKDGGDGTKGPTFFSKLKRLLAILIAGSFILSFAGLIFGLGFSDSMNVLTLAGFAAVMTLTGFIVICFIKLPSLLKEWAALSLWLILPVLSLSVISLTPENIAIPSAIMGLGIGFISKTKTPLIAAGLCLLALGYITLPFDPGFEEYHLRNLTEYETLALIASVLGFIGIAISVKSRLVLFLSLTSFMLWSGLWMFSTGLSQLALASLIFITGAAKYKTGKAALDNNAFGALTFITMGWLIASFGYLWLQSGYLFTENNALMSLGNTPNSSRAWMILCAVSLAAILIAGMSRHAHSRQSALSIFLTTLGLGAIPFMAYRPDIAFQYISSVPGMKTVPTVGLILAAGGIIVFTSMIVNGLRVNRKTYIALGLLALGAQLVLLLDPFLYTIDNVVVFGASLFVIGGLLTLFVQSKA